MCGSLKLKDASFCSGPQLAQVIAECGLHTIVFNVIKLSKPIHQGCHACSSELTRLAVSAAMVFFIFSSLLSFVAAPRHP